MNILPSCWQQVDFEVGQNNILQQAEPPKPNITKEMQEALKNLKEDDSIMILPADKGRASVVLNTDTYYDKMKTLIETGPYQLLNKDPTDRLSRKLTEKLLSLKRSGHLSETVWLFVPRFDFVVPS